MLIKVDAERHKFSIPIPLSIIPAGLIASNAGKWSNDSGIEELSPEALKAAIKKVKKELKRSKKLLNGEPLIDVKSSDGEIVKIFL
jgi:hypothetical protein